MKKIVIKDKKRQHTVVTQLFTNSALGKSLKRVSSIKTATMLNFANNLFSTLAKFPKQSENLTVILGRI